MTMRTKLTRTQREGQANSNIIHIGIGKFLFGSLFVVLYCFGFSFFSDISFFGCGRQVARSSHRKNSENSKYFESNVCAQNCDDKKVAQTSENNEKFIGKQMLSLRRLFRFAFHLTILLPRSHRKYQTHWTTTTATAATNHKKRFFSLFTLNSFFSLFLLRGISSKMTITLYWDAVKNHNSTIVRCTIVCLCAQQLDTYRFTQFAHSSLWRAHFKSYKRNGSHIVKQKDRSGNL